MANVVTLVKCPRYSSSSFPPTGEISLFEAKLGNNGRPEREQSLISKEVGTMATQLLLLEKYGRMSREKGEELRGWLREEGGRDCCERSLRLELESPLRKLMKGEDVLGGRPPEGKSKHIKMGCALWRLLREVEGELLKKLKPNYKPKKEKVYNYHIELQKEPKLSPQHFQDRVTFVHNLEIHLRNPSSWGFLGNNKGQVVCLLLDPLPGWAKEYTLPHVSIVPIPGDQEKMVEVLKVIFGVVERFFERENGVK